MHKVLVLSDTHGLTGEIGAIKARHQVDKIIHCGDSELEENAKELQEMTVVKGNCDYANFPVEQNIVINNTAFYITHGHLYSVNTGLMRLANQALENNAQIICFGHTHIAGAGKLGQQLFINPGSIRQSRSKREESYAIVEWKELDQIDVSFFTVTGKHMDTQNFNIK